MQWKCHTHHVSLRVMPTGERYLRGTMGEVGVCVLAQSRPETEYAALANEQVTRRVQGPNQAPILEMIQRVGGDTP